MEVKRFALTVSLSVRVSLALLAGACASSPPAIVIAAEAGDVAALRRALATNSDPDAMANALEIAVRNHNLEAVNVLLDRGGMKTDTAYCAAVIAAKKDVVDAFVTHGLKPPPGVLASSIKHKHADVIRALLAADAVPDEAALDAALEQRNDDLANELLKKGARSSPGSLCVAVPFGNPDLVRALAEKGADVNYQMRAARWRSSYNTFNEETFRGLAEVREFKADTIESDDHGVTPLALAVKRGSKQIVDLLLGLGAKTDVLVILDERWERTTPLIRAVRDGQVSIVKLLLAHGANPFLPDGSGVMPAEHAEIRGSKKILDMIHAVPAPTAVHK